MAKREVHMSGLDKAITAAGGKRRLALALNIKSSSLSRWIHKYQGQVPPKRVIQVYEATGITPHELRPDLHPNPTSGLPENDTATAQKESD